LRPIYGYFRAEFFYVGFVWIDGRFVHVGFYNDLGDFRKYLRGFRGAIHDPGAVRGFMEDLERYFAGERVTFQHPVELSGTNFQIEVWRAVREIPFGEMRSYRWVAERIGRPDAARAVANALRRNPVALIVPCHRVVRSDGVVAGSGFGRRVREYLLRLEGALR